MEKCTVLIKNGESWSSKESGKYIITNNSNVNTVKIIGGVNSTMLFALRGLSTAEVVEEHGIILFAEKGDVIVTVRIMSNATDKNGLKGCIFCIDAGHGGSDPGAVNKDHYEKDTALNICDYLADMLGYSGASVAMTRSDDSRLSLSSRASMANSVNATAFISVHLNSATSKSATGYEVLVYNDKKESVAKTLASNICDEMSHAVTWRNRGIKARPDLTVLKKTTMPAVLVEVGFISNDDESMTLRKEQTQMDVARAIFNGIKKTYEKRT